MQEKVYMTNLHDVEELRRLITLEWEEFYQTVIDAAISQWRPRLTACGGRIGTF